jgi:hypothetical protein
MKYSEFLENKKFNDVNAGFDAPIDLFPEILFPFQKKIVAWALKRGRAAIFADTGLGKTFMQLTWAYWVWQHTGNRVLIVAPLCVAQQSIKEADKLGFGLKYVRSQDECLETGLYITNYEMLDKFDFESNWFDGIVLDESSILKHQDSKTRNKIISNTKTVPFRLSCTATPSPNDFMELGNQSEFLGVMPMSEMLAMFFVNDLTESAKWRLKGHGARRFWEWLSKWCVYIKKPSDIGEADDGYDLPKLHLIEHTIETNSMIDGQLFAMAAKTMAERRVAKRQTIEQRVDAVAEMVNKSDEPWIVWCHLNAESEMLKSKINGAIEIKGSDKIDHKVKSLVGFSEGTIQRLVTKPSIAGFGLNWQHCRNMAFVGLNDSFEEFYQAVRRCYRFGQTKEVFVHIFSSDLEGEILKNIKEKNRKNEEMAAELAKHMSEFSIENISRLSVDRDVYKGKKTIKFDQEFFH